MLVQRSVLDLVTAYAPLETQPLTQHHTVLLTKALLPVLLRREFALTRRLHGWLLAPSGDSMGSNARMCLVDAMNGMFDVCEQVERAFRVMRVVLEKPELKESMIDGVVVNALETLRTAPEGSAEVAKQVWTYYLDRSLRPDCLFVVGGPSFRASGSQACVGVPARCPHCSLLCYCTNHLCCDVKRISRRMYTAF